MSVTNEIGKQIFHIGGPRGRYRTMQSVPIVTKSREFECDKVCLHLVPRFPPPIELITTTLLNYC
jgi:hypothetical protein